MDELVVWLSAQLDEDERIARACSGNGEWEAEHIAIYGPDLGVEVRAHMAAHDPARVLREIDAKRRLLSEHTPQTPKVRPGMERHCLSCTTAQSWDEAAGQSNCLTLRLLALPYADRPGYRKEWRP